MTPTNDGSPARRRFLGMRRRSWLLLAIVVVVAAGIYVVRHRGETHQGQGGRIRGLDANRIQPVSVAAVRVADVPIWLTALGTVTPKNLVTVKSRVDGQLMRVNFDEGQMVKAGQLLAEVDPRPFQAQLQQAEGQLQRDRALLENARLDLQRYQELLARDSISKQQVDTQVALVKQYEGTVATDQGQVDNARLQLSYCRIVSPIAGRVGLRQVDPGNQIHASDANGVVVVAQLQPMTAVFSIPEVRLPLIARQSANYRKVVVEAWDQGQKNLIAKGNLLTTDNLIDTATGTIRLRAEFANQDSALFPNQFVNVRLLAGMEKDQLVIPAAALLRGEQGAFVFVVDAQNTVHPVTVTPGQSGGDIVAVHGSLKAGDRVVMDGADKLRDGAKVEVIEPGARNADNAAQPRNNGKGRHHGAANALPGN